MSNLKFDWIWVLLLPIFFIFFWENDSLYFIVKILFLDLTVYRLLHHLNFKQYGIG